MKKYFLLCNAILFASLPTANMAMKTERDISQPTFKNCWFYILPPEVRDYIANFLTFDDYETDQEFVERTKALKIKKVSDKYYKHLPSLKSVPKPLGNIIAASCPNNQVTALLRLESDFYFAYLHTPTPPNVTIIDKKNKKLLYHTLDKKEYSHIAITRKGDIVGTMYSEHYIAHNELDREKVYYKKVVTITNLNSKQQASYEIPNHFVLPFTIHCKGQHPIIAFNKQGTQVIIHGRDSHVIADKIKRNLVPHHMIIPLTVNTPDPTDDNRKTLEKYFKQRSVFEQIT